MRKRTLTLLAAAAIGLTASQVASAADLARRAPPPAPAYVPPAPLPYLWTGCYVGGNIGGAWSNIDVTNVATGGSVSASNSGFAGGGQIGCDYQAGAWVFGFRDMLDGTSLSKSATLATVPFTGTVDSHTHWFDTLTARGGYLVAPNVLLYAQGGAAWTNTDITFFNGAGTQIGEFSNNRTGWTAGGGVDTRSAAFPACGGNCVLSAKANIQDALVGLNYKF
jgi:outer membrane immunogenic protein